jgi:hypothetical protein
MPLDSKSAITRALARPPEATLPALGIGHETLPIESLGAGPSPPLYGLIHWNRGRGCGRGGGLGLELVDEVVDIEASDFSAGPDAATSGGYGDVAFARAGAADGR